MVARSMFQDVTFARLRAPSLAVAFLAVAYFMLMFSPVAFASSDADVSDSGRRPNIILILADDLGWNDVGYHGSEIRTPNIDRLAREGVELDRFYAYPSCTPTRAALLTGQSALRTGMTQPISSFDSPGLPLYTKLLPQWLGEVGYQTSLIGKWHLGSATPAYFPHNRGFDHFYGHLGGFIDYYDHGLMGAVDWQRNGVTVHEDGYSTELITAEAIKLLQHRDKTRPLFMLLAYNAPHGPQAAPQSSIGLYSKIENEKRRVYAAMVDNMDVGIGEVLKALQAEDIAHNTLIVFMSDNGGSSEFPASAVSHSSAGNNEPLRSGKTFPLEGGIRVPAAAWWSGVLHSKDKIEQMITVEDILPTVFEAAGLPVAALHTPEITRDENRKLDGISRWNVMLGDVADRRPPFVFGMPLAGAGVIDGDWKLVRLDGPPLPWVDPTTELFRIVDDPLENSDLSAAHPEIVARLQPHIDAFDAAAGEGFNVNPIKMLALQMVSATGNIRFTPYAEALQRESVTVSGDLVFNQRNRHGDASTGVQQYQQNKSYGGYVLLSPQDASATYLIDMEGQVVHSWPLPQDMSVSMVARLLDNGHLLRGIKRTDKGRDKSGPGTIIQELDWQGKLVWEYKSPGQQTRLRDDYYRLGNGNTLFMAFEEITRAEAIALGATQERIGNGVETLWPNKLVEVNPAGDIVWEWRFQDHFSSAMHGNQNDPGRVDINITELNLTEVNRDMAHSGVIDYHAGNDQIMVTARIASEVYIIDHSTANYDNPQAGIEAARGPAGAIARRYGNPGNYGAGKPHVGKDPGDRLFFAAHGPNWVAPGLPGAGNLLVHNNGVGRSGAKPENQLESMLWSLRRLVLGNTGDYTTIDEIDADTGRIVWRFRAADPQAISSFKMGSAYRLPNGNTHVTSGQYGHLFEVTPQGEVVWEYVSPVSALGALKRPLAYPFHPMQTSYRFSEDHPGLRGKELTPQGTILELEPATAVGARMAAFVLRYVQNGTVGKVLVALLVIWVWRRWRRRRAA